jgi:NADH:ubiquinone oxidoreductase subunit
MAWLKQLFTWWNGTTIGTRIYTWRRGSLVGTDAAGNRYYEGDGGRRWVQYNGDAEASAIPPGWHGWMHHKVDTPPGREAYTAREWQKPHIANPTGTAGAHRPAGSLLRAEPAPVKPDYEAWKPE